VDSPRPARAISARGQSVEEIPVALVREQLYRSGQRDPANGVDLVARSRFAAHRAHQPVAQLRLASARSPHDDAARCSDARSTGHGPPHWRLEREDGRRSANGAGKAGEVGSLSTCPRKEFPSRRPALRVFTLGVPYSRPRKKISPMNDSAAEWVSLESMASEISLISSGGSSP
jgi:hypothetical protein